MVAERKYIDLDDIPSLANAAKESRRSGETIDLRIGGKKIAEMKPVASFDPDVFEKSALTSAIPPPLLRRKPGDKEALMRLAGAWADVDTDAMIEEIYESRDLSPVRSFEW